MDNNLYILSHKHFSGEITPEEADVLADLLKQEPNRVVFEDLKVVWEKSGQIPQPVFDSRTAFDRFQKDSSVPRTLFKSATRTLFAVLLVLLVSALVYNLYFSAPDTVVHAYADGPSVILDDGSVVYLAPDAVIKYDTDYAAHRQVQLQGRALFAVNESSNSDFTVDLGADKIIVHGTTFLVSAQNDKLDVEVIEGRVEVLLDEASFMLNEREGLTDTADGTVTKNKLSFTDVDFYTPDLEYNNEPVSKVFADLEIVYKVRFEWNITNDVSACTFTSKSLKDLPLDDVLHILEAALDTDIERIDEKSFRINKLSCK